MPQFVQVHETEMLRSVVWNIADFILEEGDQLNTELYSLYSA